MRKTHLISMNARLLLIAPFLAAFVSPLPVEQLLFEARAGSEFSMSFSSMLTLDLEEYEETIIIDGVEQDQPGPDIDMTVSMIGSIVMRDEILQIEDGLVTRLRRTFDEISSIRSSSMEGELGSRAQDTEGESELEGTAVIFKWDSEEEEYVVEFDENDDGDEDLLEDLNFDIHLVEFLPDGAVSRGDSWEVDAAVLGLLNAPGGDLQVVMDSEEDDEEDDMGIQWDNNLEGTITCKLTEVAEEDGMRIALIELMVEAESNPSHESDFEVQGSSGTVCEPRELTFELEGELQWNLDLGRAVALKLGGDVAYTTTTTRSGSGERSFSIDAVYYFEGYVTFEVTVEGSEASE